MEGRELSSHNECSSRMLRVSSCVETIKAMAENIDRKSDGTSPDMAQVHAAWLAAGANGDVVTMRLLKRRFPEWLDLQQQVRFDTLDSTSSRCCSWNGFDLNTLGASALHTAAWEGQLDIMEFLLESGQDPDTGDDNGLTPMMMAIMRLNLMTMRCVFRNGVAVRRNLVVDCRDELEESVKLVISIIKLLLRFGACIDVQDENGRTALHCSTSDDALEVAKYLVDANAKIEARDKDGKTPLHYCVQEGGLLVTNLLLSSCASIDAVDKDGMSPLLLVLQRADLNVLQLFLNQHRWVVTPQRQDFSSAVLMLAVDNNVEVVVRFLVDNQYASVDIPNSKGETPLHRAILRHNFSLIELLLELDTPGESIVAVTTEERQTPLHYAALYGSSREMEAVLLRLTNLSRHLQNHTDVNILNTVDREGATCLYGAGVAATLTRDGSTQLIAAVATYRDRDAKVQLLLDHGARLFTMDYLIRELTPDNSSRLVFPAQVKQCLRSYLLESEDYQRHPDYEDPALVRVRSIEMASFTELCVQWISSLVYAGPPVTLLAILASAGYGQETLPLLLDLPIRRDAFAAWLRRLENLARCHRRCGLLLQLHNELLQAWNSV